VKETDGTVMLTPGALEGFRAYLLTVASRRLGPDLAAKVGASDLVQETLLAAGRDGGDFRGRGPDDLKPWLTGILLHRLDNARRHYRGTAKRRLSLEVPLATLGPSSPVWMALADTATSASAAAARGELITSVAEGLDALPERYRLVLLWRYSEELTFEAIGERMGISPDAARKVWGRAILRLRDALGAGHDPD
jgi:RNA polymerase sigma-70 factor (ECF subfamily)